MKDSGTAKKQKQMKTAAAAGGTGHSLIGAVVPASSDGTEAAAITQNGAGVKSGAVAKHAMPASNSGASKLRSRAMTRIMAAVVLVIGIFALAERGGAVEWLFAAVAVLTAGGSMLLPYAALGRIEAERIVHEADELVDGGPMRVTVTLKLSRMLPFMWISVQEEILNAVAPQGSDILIMRAMLPGFARQLTLSYTIKDLRRGELEFRSLAISAGDMLGLTVRSIVVDCPGRAVVRPVPPAGEGIGELPGFEAERTRQGMQPVAVFGGQMTAAASRLRRDGAGPELRGYIPGDSLRRVDWRAMARGLGMQTRMNEAEAAGTVIIVLETSASAYGKQSRLFDANAGRAAAMMKQAVLEGKRVKLITNAVSESVVYDGTGASSELREAENRLARLRLGAPAKPMSQRLSDVIAGAPRGASVLCLTAGKTGSAEAIARPSGEPGNISYGAKLAGVRGIRLMLLLSVPVSGGEEAAMSWQERLQGTGCRVKAMPMTANYGNMRPSVEEASARSSKRGGGVHVEAARG